MIKFLIFRPVSVFVLYIALFLVAILSISNLPVSLLPNIRIPEVNLLTASNDLPAEEMERSVLSPLRQVLAQVDGMESLHSTAYNGSGLIRMRFDLKKDMDFALLEVNEKIDQNLTRLPAGMERPRVIRSSSNRIPVFYLNLSYANGRQDTEEDFLRLSALAGQQFRRRLEQLPSVAIVDISGLSYQQVRIRPKEATLRMLGIQPDHLLGAIQSAQYSIGSVIVRERQFEYVVRLGRSLITLDDLRQVPVSVGGRLLRLQEVADVRLEERPSGGLFISNGKRAISLAVIKSEESTIDAIQQSVYALVEKLKEEHPELEFRLSQDQTYLLKYSINNMKGNLVTGAIMAVGLVFFFYSDWRIPLLIGSIVPMSVLLSLLFFKLFGLSINIISLAGLILGLGLLIDNGIIVLDNISQHRMEGKTVAQACITGVNEMIRPMLASMLTTCAVFFPLVFMSGLGGALFIDQAMAISIGLTVSYIVSITFLPTLYFSLFRNKPVSANLPKDRASGIKLWYHSGILFTFKHPGMVFVVLVLLLGGGLAALSTMNIERLPKLAQTAFESYIEWNESISPTAAQTRLSGLVEKWRKTVYYNAHIGQQQFLLHFDPEQRPSTVHLYAEFHTESECQLAQSELNQLLKNEFPLAKARFLPVKTVFEQLFSDNRAALEVGMMSASGATQAEWLSEWTALRQDMQTQGIEPPAHAPLLEKQVVVVPALDKLAFYELPVPFFYQELKRVLNNEQLAEFKVENTSLPIVMGGSPSDIYQTFYQLHIQNEKGARIPVHRLAELKTVWNFNEIHATEKGKFIPLHLKQGDPPKLLAYFQDYQNQRKQVRFQFQGTYFSNQSLARELLKILVVAILLLYFILAAQFESLVQPLIILLEIPLSLCGSVFLLFLFGATINAMTLIGMIVTTGIMINDSILKIDTINRLRKTNSALELKAAIHEGGLKRINSILMTSLTSIIGVFSYLFGNNLGDKLQQPLALTLIGGMVFGTLVSLFVIPLIYYYFYRRK